VAFLEVDTRTRDEYKSRLSPRLLFLHKNVFVWPRIDDGEIMWIEASILLSRSRVYQHDEVLQPAFSKIELKCGREIWISSWLPKQERCGFADYLPGNYYFLDAWCCCWRVRNDILSNPWSWGTSRFRKLTGATRHVTQNLRIAPRCCGWRARESSINLFMRAGALDVLKSNHDQLLPRNCCYSQF
jgi:hypothetical protein